MATPDSTDSTITIQLSKGFATVIDGTDSDLAEIKWHVGEMGKSAIPYAKRYTSRLTPPRKTEHLHRVILERMLGRTLGRLEFTDHIDGNSLNNRRSNLRLATPSQNSANKQVSCNSKSGLKGVYWDGNSWRASIHKGNKTFALGRFKTAEEAHAAYCLAAEKIFGEFARG